MKIFLSWSGDVSQDVACALRDWLPSVIQSLKPYVSSEDIDKGARWSSDVAQELENSTFGIICITKDNVDAPWINFEAGALSKMLDKSHVSPFLFQMDRSDVRGPLVQFQSTLFDKDDVKKLIQCINGKLHNDVMLDESTLDRAFEKWWPELSTSLSNIQPSPAVLLGNDSEQKQRLMIEELLDLARRQQKILTDPESLLPSAYIRYVIRDDIVGKKTTIPHHLIDDLHRNMVDLERRATAELSSNDSYTDLLAEINSVHCKLHLICPSLEDIL